MIFFSVLEIIFGLLLIIFATKIYQISWYATKNLTKDEIKIFIVSIRALGVLFIVLAIFTLMI
jgi:hypothetical protein